MLNPAVTETAAALRRAEQLQAALRVPFRIGTDHLRVTTNAGIAMIDRRATAAEDVVQDATVALQHSHEADSQGAVVFSLSMQPTVTSVGAPSDACARRSSARSSGCSTCRSSRSTTSSWSASRPCCGGPTPSAAW